MIQDYTVTIRGADAKFASYLASVTDSEGECGYILIRHLESTGARLAGWSLEREYLVQDVRVSYVLCIPLSLVADGLGLDCQMSA